MKKKDERREARPHGGGQVVPQPDPAGAVLISKVRMYTLYYVPSTRSPTPEALHPHAHQLLYINVQRLRGGLVCKAHRLVYHSTLGSRVIKIAVPARPARTGAAR